LRAVEEIQRDIDRAARRRAELWARSPLPQDEVFEVVRLTEQLVALFEEKRFVAVGVDLADIRLSARVEEQLERLAAPGPHRNRQSAAA
jgi:hypothetical protein